MDLDWIWKSILIIIAGTLLLRIAGRKSISQMTLAQTVIMIAIGSLLIQPVAGQNIWQTIAVGFILVLTLIGIEILQVKYNFFEDFISGKSKVVIEDGEILEDNIATMRLTVDQLEMKLRQQGVNRFKDVKYATLEPNGQIGLELKDDAKPVTMKDFREQMDQLKVILHSHLTTDDLNKKRDKNNIFKEVMEDGHEQEPPQYLD
ncbi:DUF421 domain-containing protein [Mangrovibacillus cuniculi]|uniref:DUF421 domain-containing protein n=1 Tax=Mangrovibacillus cuniculi TaxID=2593652 RepID=A0A7S8CDQ9_9BACI|nr:DUF421 domain-containing protein [Mangrovibacillus cuniculi]QPC48091.1 DUF421 domain-containing protein [Mangrovibacillus cuniculi]